MLHLDSPVSHFSSVFWLWPEGIIKDTLLLAMSYLQQGTDPGQSAVPPVCSIYFLRRNHFYVSQNNVATLKKEEENILSQRATCQMIVVI